MSSANENGLPSKEHASRSCSAIIMLLCALLMAGGFGLSGCGSEGSGPASASSGNSGTNTGVTVSSTAGPQTTNAGILPTQNWTVANEFGDVAYVIIVPFTTSVTFTESCNSPGWWLRDANNNRTVRIPLKGTVTHSGQGDIWDFEISELSGGTRFTGTGAGRSTDGAYPAARNVQGTVSETLSSPAGTQTILRTWTWSGNNYTAWN